MDYSRENVIASQALGALKLRRQRETGAITEQEYLRALEALQATPTPPQVSRPAMASPSIQPDPAGPVSSPASEISQLGRQVEAGQLTIQEYLKRRDQPPPANVPEPAPLMGPTALISQQASSPPVLNTASADTDRFLTMKCPRCIVDVRVYENVTGLRCADCQAAIRVERKDGTIALTLLETRHPLKNVDIPLPRTAKDDEIKKLQTEEAAALTVKRVVGFLGALCCCAFVYAGMVEITSSNALMGTTFLLCATALLLTVFYVTRHTNRIRAALGTQIRSLTSSTK